MKAVVTGRFQPFTLGHMKMVDYAKEFFDEVIIGVSFRNVPVFDSHNPFTHEERIEWARKATGLPVIASKGINPVYLEEVLQTDYIMVVGEDHREDMQKIASYRPGFRYLVVPRTDEDVSATKVRKALLDGNRELFKELMPRPLWSEYEHMREVVVKREGEQDNG